mgnify:CR=1 FL=1
MTTLRIIGDYNDPWCECGECDMRFQLIWNRNPVYDHAEYCPFCGVEITEIVEDLDE